MPRKTPVKKTTSKKTVYPIDEEDVDSVEQAAQENVPEEEPEDDEDDEEEEVDEEVKPVKKAVSKKNNKNKKATNNWADESPIQNTQNIQTNIPQQEMPNREFVINLDEVPKFETHKVSDVSVVDLLKVIIVRGSDNKSPNPALSCGAEKLLKQLFRVPSRPRDQEQGQGQGYTPRHNNNNRGYRGKHYSQRYPDNNSNDDPNENKDDNGEFGTRPPYQGNRNQRHPPRQHQHNQHNQHNQQNQQNQQNQHQHHNQHQHQRGDHPAGSIPDTGSQGGNRYVNNRRPNYQNNQTNRHTQATADE
jgi:hypothetical protein